MLDLAVLFARNAEMLENADFILDGSALTKILVCDLRPGLWSVTKDGRQITTVRVTDEGRCVYLEAEAGSYRLELQTAQPDIQLTQAEYRQHTLPSSSGWSFSSGTTSTSQVRLGHDVYDIKWITHETFDNDESLLHWFIEGNSHVEVNGGKLWVRNPNPEKPNVATIWYCRDLPAELIVRFRAQAVLPAESNAANLNIFLHARELNGSPVCFGRSGQYKEYHEFLNYIVTFVGGYRPGWSRLRRNPGFNLLHEADIRSEMGQEYSIAVAIWKGRLRYYIDGQLVHDVRDPQPLAGGRFAIRTWSTNAWWDDIEFGYLAGASD